MSETRPVLGITMGDPGGIGPEIILKAASDRSLSEIPFVVIGNADVLEKRASLSETEVTITRLAESEAGRVFNSKTLNVVHIGTGDSFAIGRPDRAGGKASAAYITCATALALQNRLSGIVTCPVSKEALHLAGFKYPGHTEMFADLTSTADFAMMLTARELSVVLVTTHVAMSRLSDLVKKDNITRIIRLVNRDFCSWYGRAPNIGITALNPHAGEGGIFGTEEASEIIPAVQTARSEGISVSDPLPADTIFTRQKRESFDVIIAMYHDQGLIPIKILSFGRAVNVTLGLPFVRTSVDHGTAYDIVGSGKADPGSLLEAVKLAFRLVRTRRF